MTQLSRPLQVALAAVGLLVVVWFVALRGHSSNSEPTATTHPSSSQGSSGVYHGSAPGVEGLSRDIQKAHAAVSQSEQNAAQLTHKSAEASGEAPATATASATHRASASAARKASVQKVHAKSVHAKSVHVKSVHAKGPSTTGNTHVVSPAVSATAGQQWVEGQLRQKMTVALLFYTPRAYDDSRTRRELAKLIGEERRHHTKITLRVAPASTVGSYGSFTRLASIYQTPTLLLVTPSGEVKPPITGLADGFSIEQAIDEKTQP